MTDAFLPVILGAMGYFFITRGSEQSGIKFIDVLVGLTLFICSATITVHNFTS